GLPYKIALFVPEKKGKPASVRIFPFPPNATQSHVAFKSFYKAQEVKMKWSPNGSALIIETSTDVDTSGKSYYGETNLFFVQSHGWSPDSRYFYTATTFPRVRVDNGFKLFKYDGTGPVVSESRTEVYDLQFRPAAAGVYPNRPASPPEAAAAPPAPVRKAYRPPHSTGALADMLRREDGAGARKLDRNKYAPANSAAAATKVIPGLEAPAVKKPSKSEKKKKAIEAAEAKAELERVTQELLAKTMADVPGTNLPSDLELELFSRRYCTCCVVVLTPEEKLKKAKAIQKKLKQIADIKAKQTHGDALNEDQLAKVANETALLDELAALAYDVMNDAMSGGMHRLWKDEFVNMLGPLPHRDGEPLRILDVAGGTGDIAFRMADRLKRGGLADSPADPSGRTDIVVCDINASMLRVGEERATARGIGLPGTRPSFAWVQGDAEQLAFESDSFDVYTIAFGIRNVTHVDVRHPSLAEAHRVLRKGGRFMCLEFSQVQNPLLRQLYDTVHSLVHHPPSPAHTAQLALISNG
ncbi:hypothetical protein DYB32_002489, partial [Aphanomyces invadans]